MTKYDNFFQKLLDVCYIKTKTPPKENYINTTYIELINNSFSINQLIEFIKKKNYRNFLMSIFFR